MGIAAAVLQLCGRKRLIGIVRHDRAGLAQQIFYLRVDPVREHDFWVVVQCQIGPPLLKTNEDDPTDEEDRSEDTGRVYRVRNDTEQSVMVENHRREHLACD